MVLFFFKFEKVTYLQEEYKEYKKFLMEAVKDSELKDGDKELLKNRIDDLILKCSPYTKTVEASHLYIEEQCLYLEELIEELNYLATRGEGFIIKIEDSINALHISRIDSKRKL